MTSRDTVVCVLMSRAPQMATARATQAEFEVQQAEATVRRQQQQIQGMLAGHAE
jgi:hypothetical protein